MEPLKIFVQLPESIVSALVSSLQTIHTLTMSHHTITQTALVHFAHHLRKLTPVGTWSVGLRDSNHQFFDHSWDLPCVATMGLFCHESVFRHSISFLTSPVEGRHCLTSWQVGSSHCAPRGHGADMPNPVGTAAGDLMCPIGEQWYYRESRINTNGCHLYRLRAPS